MKTNTALEVCQKCKAACCKLGGGDFSKSEMQKVLKAGYPNFFSKINNNHYELKSKKGVCPYLAKDNSCNIHKVRPLMCKCWPVYLKFKDNKKQFFLIKCPLTPIFSKQDIKLMKKQANRIPKDIITTSLSNSKLPKSDIELIEKRLKKFKRKLLK